MKERELINVDTSLCT